MRLRQLGTTQSVVFYAPPEVHQSILDVRSRGNYAMTTGPRPVAIDSAHVVAWLIEQTCRGMEQLQDLYQAQGADFCSRASAAAEHAGLLGGSIHRRAYLDVIEQHERQTLENMYGGVCLHSGGDAPSRSADITLPKLAEFIKKLRNHRRAATSATSHAAADLFAEVEQEREVEFQVEEIRQVRKPVKYTALEFSTVDDDILEFVKTGRGDRLLKFMHVFESLAETGIGMQYGIQRTLSRLYVSDEFRRTIHLAPGQLNDNFLVSRNTTRESGYSRDTANFYCSGRWNGSSGTRLTSWPWL